MPIRFTAFLSSGGSNANSFDLDRWDNLPANHPGTAYLSYWLGPRGCIGRKFAETEVKVLLICMLSKFRFQQDDKVENLEKEKVWKAGDETDEWDCIEACCVNSRL